jgi:hypothetical protein
MGKIKVKVKVKKQEPGKNTINVKMNPDDIVKPGYGENGRPLADNYLKGQRELAAVGTKYEKPILRKKKGFEKNKK